MGISNNFQIYVGINLDSKVYLVKAGGVTTALTDLVFNLYIQK